MDIIIDRSGWYEWKESSPLLSWHSFCTAITEYLGCGDYESSAIETGKVVIHSEVDDVGYIQETMKIRLLWL